MIGTLREGETPRNGLSLYAKDDPSSAGGVLRISALSFRWRYQKRFGGLFFNVHWFGKRERAAMRRWELGI